MVCKWVAEVLVLDLQVGMECKAEVLCLLSMHSLEVLQWVGILLKEYLLAQVELEEVEVDQVECRQVELVVALLMDFLT